MAIILFIGLLLLVGGLATRFYPNSRGVSIFIQPAVDSAAMSAREDRTIGMIVGIGCITVAIIAGVAFSVWADSVLNYCLSDGTPLTIESEGKTLVMQKSPTRKKSKFLLC